MRKNSRIAIVSLVVTGGWAFGTASAACPSDPTCTSPYLADFDCDGCIGNDDLSILLSFWGTPCGDLNGDGTTDGADVNILLASWNCS